MSVFLPNTSGTFLSSTFVRTGSIDLTLMGWIYLSAAAPTNYRNMIYASPNAGLSTFADGVTFDAGTSGSDHNGSVLSVNVWYHLCQTIFSNSTTNNHLVVGYINGQQNVRVSDTTTFVAYTDIGLGGDPAAPSGSFPLNGLMRDVRIWTRSLSAPEIVDEMHSGIPIHRAGLFAWSPLDDNTFADKSGNNNVWTTTGSGISLQSGPLQPFPKKRGSFPK